MVNSATLQRTLTKGMNVRHSSAYLSFTSEDDIVDWIDDKIERYFINKRTGKLKKSVRLTLTLEAIENGNGNTKRNKARH